MTIAWYKDKIGCLVLFVISLILFTRSIDIHGLEYRDDEVFYVQSTQEMLQNNEYLSPTYFGEDRYQKPILFYWFILLSYKLFGVSWFSARVVSALFGAMAVSLTWLLARDFFGRKIANLSAVILMTIPMFLRHAKNAVPDMALNFFIVFSMYCIARIIFLLDREELGNEEKKLINLTSIFLFVSIALGFMVKGLAAVSVPLIVLLVYVIIHKDLRLIASLRLVRGIIILAVFIIPWFWLMASHNGNNYVDHMVLVETKDRILGVDHLSLLGWLRMLINHIGYYIYVIFSYFAPWSIFAFIGIPSILRFNRLWLERHRLMVNFLLIWILAVLFIFSIMAFRINHYMLVLTTPFAIMVSLFFLEKLDRKIFLSRWIFYFQKAMSLLVFVICVIALILLIVVFLKQPIRWAIILTVTASFGIFWIAMTPRQRIAPWILAVTLMLTFANSRALTQAGITFHSVLQKFANTIHHQETQESIVAVGSNDIHEKEFQVYFSQPVIKLASSSDEQTVQRLSEIFDSNQTVYCLITAFDYERYLKTQYPQMEIIQEEAMFRKRLYLDRKFFYALLDLDREVIFPYFMEKVLLVKQESKL